MTIEGGGDQQGASKIGGSGIIPAPFTNFVDIASIPDSALTNSNAEDSTLPTIDEIKEFMDANKIKEVN